MSLWFQGSRVLWRLRIVTLDIVLHLSAVVLALFLRDDIFLDPRIVRDAVPYMTFTVTLAALVSVKLRLDRSFWRFITIADSGKVILGAFVTASGATAIAFLYNRLDGLSLTIPILHFLIAVFALVSARLLVRAWHQREERRTFLPSQAPVTGNVREECVMFIGVNRLSAMLLTLLTEPGNGQARIAGLIGLDSSSSGRNLSGHHIFGPEESLSDILGALAEHGVTVSRFIVTVGFDQLSARLLAELAAVEAGRSIKVVNVSETMGSVCSATTPQAGSQPNGYVDLGDLSIDALEIDRILRRPYWKIKRVAEIALAAVLLIVLSPVMAVLALAVAGTLGSPILFWQVRTGYFGCSFRMHKFRTMTAALGDDGQPVDAERRVSCLGRFLRATHLDELPQLWNILTGEMSFVGPRPLLPIDQAPGSTLRCLVRPGLTGWAQVMGGRSVQAADKMALDTYYVRHASFRLDLEIVARTLPVIVFGERISHEAIERAWQDLADTTSAPSKEPADVVLETFGPCVGGSREGPKRSPLGPWMRRHVPVGERHAAHEARPRA